MGKFKKAFAVVALLIMGSGLIIVGVRELMNSRQLAAQGKTAIGEVTDVILPRRAFPNRVWRKLPGTLERERRRL
jgi:hypothetical protein